MFRWFKRKPQRPCQCGHWRCYHNLGYHGCNVTIRGETADGAPCVGLCPCVTFVAARSTVAEREVEALERMMK